MEGNGNARQQIITTQIKMIFVNFNHKEFVLKS